MKQESDENETSTESQNGKNNHNNNKKRKRGLKPKSKRNRKRARGGVGILFDSNNNGDEGDDLNRSEKVQIDVIPLEIKDEIEDGEESSMTRPSTSNPTRKRLRVVRPYPFTFSTWAKARWIGRSILDVYNDEFGSYPKCYYESAIRNGRILVSGGKVDCNYLVKGGDELSHVVHRHEPAVAICDAGVEDDDEDIIQDQSENSNKESEKSTKSIPSRKCVSVIHEDEDVIVVDKPSTIPVHPCGGYNFNSLFHILSEQDPSLEGKLHNVHRLDRLTSGLTVVAKTSEVAKTLGKCINDRDGCHKSYLARVKGRFPLNAPLDKKFMCEKPKESEKNEMVPPPCIYGEWSTVHEECGEPATTFWVSNNKEGKVQLDSSLDQVFQSRIDLTKLNSEGSTTSKSSDDDEDILWLNLSCPCEIVCFKNGVCKAGAGKPAQTSFAVVHYDEETDSTVVLAKPVTGRTHQIRLHLQYLGHPIANDPNYGGEIFFGDNRASDLCQKAREKMSKIDDSVVGIDQLDRPNNALSTDKPASVAEVKIISDKERCEGESLLNFIKRSCVWCERSKGEDRNVLEFLVRSPGIWLHALQYSLMGTNGQLTYKTDIPAWSRF